jgi:antitoxin component YwqK of YwqJK toxin-antitoxin module
MKAPLVLLLLCQAALAQNGGGENAAGQQNGLGGPGSVAPGSVAPGSVAPMAPGSVAAPGQPAIETAAQCKAAGGRWEGKGRFVGCLVRGQRQGYWAVYDELEGGRRVRRAWARLVGGILDGPSVDFHENGEKAAEGAYQNGKKVGLWHGWHPGGQDRFIETYDAEGRRHGKSVWWYPHCGKAHDGAFFEDVEDGPWTRWYITGDKQDEGTYARGVRTGTWTFWHPDGPKLESGPFVNGVRQGTWTEWTFQGHEWRKVEYIDDERQTEHAKACREAGGTWQVDHQTREDGCDLRGRHGLWSGYHPKGELMWTSTYTGGIEEGTHTDFHPTGEILRQGEYKAGIPVGTHVFRKADGTVLGEATLTEGTGLWQTWWHTGFLRERGQYVGGLKDGAWETWFEDGNPDEATVWVRGRARGGDAGVVHHRRAQAPGLLQGGQALRRLDGLVRQRPGGLGRPLQRDR